MFVRFISAALVLAAALPAFAAEDTPLPPLTPKGEYLAMTQDDATSSSKCIGNPVTPMCAVETVMACDHRANDDLCRIGMGLNKNPGRAGEIAGPNIMYRVVRREVLTDRRFPWKPRRDYERRGGAVTMKAGDIRIDIRERWCWGENIGQECESIWDLVPTAYIVRHEGDRWAVMTTGYAYDPRTWRR